MTGQDDKKPRDLVACTADMPTDYIATNGYEYILKSKYEELARKLEAAARERDEWEIREQMARARNSKLVAALERITVQDQSISCNERIEWARAALEENK